MLIQSFFPPLHNHSKHFRLLQI